MLLSAPGVLADDVTLRSSWAIVVSSVFKRSYPQAPVSPLLLFARKQCLAYQQEVEGNAAQRHHVRFWRCPDGWLLPGGRRVQWLGGGTYDRSVGLSLFTLQITHKIDADIDIERDYIVDSLRHYNPEAGVDVIADFSTGYHHRNGGGDLIRTDGDLPVVDLTTVPVTGEDPAALPHGVVRAARGYPVATAEGGTVAPDPDAPSGAVDDEPGAKRPPSIVVACAFTLLLAVTGLVDLALDFGGIRDEMARETPGPDVDLAAWLVVAVLAVVYLALAALAALTFLGRSRPRVWLMATTTVSLVAGEAMRVTGARDVGWSPAAYLDLAAGVLVLLTLTEPAASEWSRRRRARRAVPAPATGPAPTGGR